MSIFYNPYQNIFLCLPLGEDLEEGLVAVTEEDSEEASQYKRLV